MKSSPQEEKLMNIFWLRPAYQRHSWGIKWWRRSTQKRLALTTTKTATTLILIFLFVICISALVFAGWIDLVSSIVLRFFLSSSFSLFVF